MAQEQNRTGNGPSRRVRRLPRQAKESASRAIASAQRGAGWVERDRYLGVIVATAQRIGDQHLPTYAAAIGFQAVVSLFPLIAFVLAAASFFVDPEVLTARVLELAKRLAPVSDDLLTDTIRSVTEMRGGVGIISLVGLLWSGSNLFGALRRGLNAATGAARRRTFVWARLFDLGIALLTGLLLGLSVALTAGVAVLQQAEIPGASPVLVSLGGLLNALGVAVPFIMTTLTFSLLYRLAPAERMAWWPAVAGGALAALLFEAGKNVFVWYTATFGAFNVVYGPIATVVVLLLWLYYSSLILLGGAAFGSELAARRKPAPTGRCSSHGAGG